MKVGDNIRLLARSRGHLDGWPDCVDLGGVDVEGEEEVREGGEEGDCPVTEVVEHQLAHHDPDNTHNGVAPHCHLLHPQKLALQKMI